MRRNLWICIALVSLFVVGMLPMPTSAVIDYYNPNGEDIEAGTKESGTFPDGIDDKYRLAIRYREASLDLKVKYEWDDVPPTRLILEMRSKVTDNGICSDEYVDVQAYNSSSSDWDTLFVVSESAYVETSTELTWHQLNDSRPTVRFLGQDPLACLQDSLNFTIDYISIYDYYTKKITDLEDELAERIAELERELERLRERLGDSLPDVYVNETALPTVPSGYGYLDYDAGSTKPYRSTVYTVRANDSGSSMAFYLPRPGTSDESRYLMDRFYFAGSFTTIWINDTSGTVIFTSSDAVAFWNAETCQNLTVETTGGNIRADRHVRIRLIDFFEWGEDKQTQVFSYTSSTTNEIAYNMEVVRVYWGFPYEESGTLIDSDVLVVDIHSLVVTDMSHGHILKPGKHYVAYDSGIALELRWLNRSARRVFKIEFAREPEPGSNDAHYVIQDTDIEFSNVYEDCPYVVHFVHTVEGTADFQGTVIVQWDLTGPHIGRKLNVSALRIQRSDESGFLEYWYDSIGDELHITGQHVASGDSIEYVIYLNWYEGKSFVESLAELPLLLMAAMVMVAIIGVAFIMTEEGRRKYIGYVCLAYDAIVLLLLMAGGGF